MVTKYVNLNIAQGAQKVHVADLKWLGTYTLQLIVIVAAANRSNTETKTSAQNHESCRHPRFHS